MLLTNSQLINFVNRIKLKQDKKNQYKSQVDNIISELTKSLNNNTDMKVKSVIRAGSWKKGTALRPKPEKPLDIDLVFFLDLAESSAYEISALHDTILKFLLKTYPTKSKEDFIEGSKTVGLIFRGSKLEADIVPVVPLESNPSYAWQPEKGGKGHFATSVYEQIDFVASIKEIDPHYANIVRMLKTWKNRQELEIPSFAIELVHSHLILTQGKVENIEDGVIRFFEFLSRSEFPFITFPGAMGSIKFDSNGPVYIADPTNNENNVLERMDASEWDEVVNQANGAMETLAFAQAKHAKGETIELWKEIFGPSFNIEEEE